MAAKPAAAAKPAEEKKGGAPKAPARAKALIDLAAARPLAGVVGLDGKPAPAPKGKKAATVKLPNVLFAPIRNDIVGFVHTSMAKNRRQAYAVSYNTGMQHAAESWGTGRAVARIPRISGGGTSRSGQGAFANMVRGGRMFAPTKIWRKWHRKINTNQKRFAVASALAASALPALVMARGHRIDALPEVPLVAVDDVQKISRTKDAIKFLKAVGAYADVEKAKASRKLRAGVGKMRNRRHVQRRGPLVVYNEDAGITRAFRNLPGVEICQVDRLNLLQLAPGGHVGRFIIWSQSAMNKLDSNWGSVSRASTQKAGYTLPRPIMIQSDLTRLINSDEVQSKVRPAVKHIRRSRLKKNPLTNLGAMVTLNPYALALRRSEVVTSAKRAALRKALIEAKRKGIKPADIKGPLAGAIKNAVAEAAAAKKADALHKKKGAKAANWARLSGAGAPDRKPVVVEEKFEPPKVPVRKAGAAAAKPEVKAEKPADKPAAAPKAAAAPAADKPAAKPAADKPKADGADKKKDGDKKKPEGGDKKKADGGDKKKADGGDKKKAAGDKKDAGKKKDDKKA